MTADEVMTALESLGNPQTVKIFRNHGAQGDLFGVKVGDMKPLVKKIKKDHALSLELYETGNGDARYFAGLIADEQQISKADLQRWAEQADWYMISEYTVAWVAAESRFGLELALEWIESDNPRLATAGWSTLGSLATITPDDQLDLDLYSGLIDRVVREIHDSPNRVRYTMNGFVLAAGCAIAPLAEKAMEAGRTIGKVHVEMGGTACKVPDVPTYIQKVIDKGRLGSKKKQARC